jgi:hypothetical protein
MKCLSGLNGETCYMLLQQHTLRGNALRSKQASPIEWLTKWLTTKVLLVLSIPRRYPVTGSPSGWSLRVQVPLLTPSMFVLILSMVSLVAVKRFSNCSLNMGTLLNLRQPNSFSHHLPLDLCHAFWCRIGPLFLAWHSIIAFVSAT